MQSLDYSAVGPKALEEQPGQTHGGSVAHGAWLIQILLLECVSGETA